MDIGRIDFWANNWDSELHRASALSKLVGTGLVIGAVVITGNFFVLLAMYLILIAAITSTRLPALKIMMIGASPAVFAILFAISRWDGTFLTPAVIILKALVASTAMVTLITTTPYPQVFGFFHTFLPRIVGDGLFLTYRSLFILLGLMNNLLTALRLRGGLQKRHYVKNGKNITFGLGLLLVRSLELSERFYDVLQVRGYKGRLVTSGKWRHITAHDSLPLSIGALVLGFAIAESWYPLAVSRYNGYFLLLAVLALLSAAVVTRTRSVRVLIRR